MAFCTWLLLLTHCLGLMLWWDGVSRRLPLWHPFSECRFDSWLFYFQSSSLL